MSLVHLNATAIRLFAIAAITVLVPISYRSNSFTRFAVETLLVGRTLVLSFSVWDCPNLMFQLVEIKSSISMGVIDGKPTCLTGVDRHTDILFVWVRLSTLSSGKGQKSWQILGGCLPCISESGSVWLESGWVIKSFKLEFGLGLSLLYCACAA